MNYYHIDRQTLTIIAGPHAADSAYLRKLTQCGQPDRLDLAAYDQVPEVYADLGPGQKHGGPVVTNDAVTFPAVDKTAEEILAETYVEEIGPFQLRAILRRYGLFANVTAAIATLDEEAQDKWEYATVVRRSDPLLQQLAAGLGLTDQQVHQMFWEASQIL